MAARSTTGKKATLFADRYRIISNLGAGGMATVELAMDDRLDRLVAIKVIHSHLQTNRVLIERFKTEARTVAALHSPYIVEIHDFGLHEGNLFFVMEFIDGQTLNWILDRLNHEPMDPDVAAAIVCQIAEGLTVAANAGIVHRDLKPENILISSQGYLKITDFGIAYLKDEAHLTSTGQVLGTPRFMSPEQVRGKREISHQCDLFSVGVVLYYCLTGHLPFQANSIPGVMAAIADEPHQPICSVLPGVDADLERLVETLLQKEPARRGPGAAWLQSELKKYLFRRGVVDPIARIREYIQELSSRGIQTVRELDWLEVDIAVKQHNEKKKTRVTLGRYSTFRGQVTHFFDPKSKWLWGVLLFALSVAGLLFVYAVKMNVIPFKPAQPAQAQAKTVPPSPTLEPIPTASPALSTSIPLPVKSEQARETHRKLSAPYHEPAQPRRPIQNQTESDAMAKVNINSTPPFAEITVGNKSWGFCPLSGFAVKPGRYRLRVSWRKMKSIDTTIQVSEGVNHFRFYLDKE